MVVSLPLLVVSALLVHIAGTFFIGQLQLNDLKSSLIVERKLSASNLPGVRVNKSSTGDLKLMVAVFINSIPSFMSGSM